MPELPEVEVLARHLRPLLLGRVIHGVSVAWPKVVQPDSPPEVSRALVGRRFREVGRRGKYLLFGLDDTSRATGPGSASTLIGHLGMTGRMYVQPKDQAVPRHAAVTLDLGPDRFVFEDPRRFGRLSLDAGRLEGLGPEPWDDAFTPEAFRKAIGSSRQPIKVKLLDQSVVAGVGNIYASEALFQARVDPRLPSRRLSLADATRLVAAIRDVLDAAIGFGSGLPLGFDGSGTRDGLFYYGRASEDTGSHEERLNVYDRADQACRRCGHPVRRLVQSARSTFWCPTCQGGGPPGD